MNPSLRLASAVSLAGVLIACSDGSAPTTRSQVTFNLATGSLSSAALLVSDTFATPTDTLVLDSVQLVLRDIKFQRINEDACDGEHNDDGDDDHDSDDGARPPVLAASLHDDHGDDDGDNGEDDACESFNAGPYLLDLPLGPDVVKAFSVAVDTGTFDQLRFKLHKPEDDSGDPRDIAFLAAHPEFANISIRAVGTFNGEPFEFTSDLDAQQRMDLVPPLVVAGSMQNVDVTIKVDVSGWFADQAGGLVNPASGNKGEPNEDLVKDNIRDSFHAFRDDDQDGEDDDDHGEHD
jgi:hypothetical protein